MPFSGSSSAVSTNIPNSPNSTLAPVAISNLVTGGNIGLATTTVDINSTFVVTQTTAGQTLTLPNPTVSTGSRIVTLQNSPSSTTSIVIYSKTLLAGQAIDLLWNGSSWVHTAGGDPTTQTLTYGRVNALSNLTAISYASTGNGAAVNFNNTVYSSGISFSGTNGITPSVTGRYRLEWLLSASGTQVGFNGFANIVQNGVTLASLFMNMDIDTSRANVITQSVDLNLAAGQAVTLHYQPTSADTIGFDQGSYFQLSQLPTAVAPVVNTVAEYGTSALVGTTISVNDSAATWVTRALSMTLPSAGTYRISWQASAEIGDNGTVQTVLSGRLFNSTTSTSFPKTLHIICGNDNETVVQTNAVGTGGGEDFITVAEPTTIVFQTKMTALASAVAFILGDASVQGTTYISYEKIAGQLPTTGTTVDYVAVRRLTTNQTGIVVNTDVIYNSFSTGNIPYNTGTGVFTLTAGKTYQLDAFAKVRNDGTGTTGRYVQFEWVDAVSNTALTGLKQGVSVMSTSTLNESGTDNAGGIYTPSTTQTIKVRVTGVDGSNVELDANRTFASIVQIGSSAVYAGVYPGTWTSYTPVVTSTGGTNPTLPTAATITGSYSIQGKTMFLNIRYNSASVAGGTDGTGSYQWSIPGGYVIDTTKAAIPSVLTNTSGSGLDGGVVGTGFGRNSTGGNSAGLMIMPLSTTTIGAWFEPQTRLIGAGALAMTGASNTTYSFVCQIPIV